MQQVRFQAQKREGSGKGAARSLRRAGNIPAILYGRNQEVIPLQLEERTFQHFLRSYGENAVVELDIADHGVETVLLKEVQRHPVKNNLLHTDFIRISMAEPVTAPVSLVLVGTAPGVQQEGGVLEFPHREVTLHCLPTLLPEEIEIDISNMEINDFIYVGDLSVAEGIEVLDDEHTVIVTVSPPRIEEVEEELEEEGEEELLEEPTDEEPEVISRRRDDDEE